MLEFKQCTGLVLYTVGAIVCVSLFIVLFAKLRALIVREHRWILPPNCVTKYTSLSVPFLKSVACIGYAFIYLSLTLDLWSSNYWWVHFSSVIAGVIDNVARFLYYIYLIANIEHNMKTNEIVKIAVNKRFKNLLCVIKIVLFINIIQGPLYYILVVYHKNAAYDYFNGVLYIIFTVFYDFSLLFVYVVSSNKWAQYWYTLHWLEYQEWGITERQHEILLVCTRYCISFGVSVIGNMLVMALYLLYYHGKSSHAVFFLWILFDIINDVLFCVAIYWSYPFGHASYLKVVGKLHSKMYNKLVNAHKKQIENGYISMDDFHSTEVE